MLPSPLQSSHPTQDATGEADMSNGFKIEVPQDYFSRIAAKEYSDDAGMAVVREFAQNSADAGATVVKFNFGSDGSLLVEDDGKGCDLRTVKERILTPLGSQKDGDAIGGFGKAKELLFFANSYWCIRTRDVEAVGSQLTVQSLQDGLTFQPGFAAKVQLPAALYLAAKRAAREFFTCSERPGVRWVLNGEEVQTYVQCGTRAVKDFGFAKAYVNRESHDSRIYLRTGGLLTATRWGHHGGDVGRVVIEVTGKSSDLLTPARDWFRADEHRRAVEGWLNQLVVNARQTLADREGDEIQFLDFSPVEQSLKNETAKQVKEEVVPRAEGGMRVPVKFSGVEAATSGAALAGSVPQGGLAVLNAALEGMFQPGTRPAPAPKARRPDGFDMGLLPRLDGVRSVVVHTGSKARAKVGMKWLQKNAELAQKLLAAWATAAFAVAKRNGLTPDAVGFTFVEDAEAEFIASNGRFGVLLNPLTLDAGDYHAADELLDRALHEMAHLFSGAHDERFVLAEVQLRRKVRGPDARGATARALRTSAVQVLDDAE